MKIALLQMTVTADKAENLRTACAQIKEAAQNGAELVILPEMFNCPYTTACFPRYAERRGENSWLTLSLCAAENRVCLVGGSIPEEDRGQIYNTCFVFGPDGRELARHRKVHLFDVAFEGGQVFRESDTFTPGEDVTTFAFGGMTFGLCICFDFRFPELARLMTLKGAQVLLVPAAFNMTTGPLHWETMFRQRAVDNQVYTVGTAPARDERGPYVSYANSILCDPLGRVLTRADAEPCILYGELEPAAVESARQQLPLLKARRCDLYELIEK